MAEYSLGEALLGTGVDDSGLTKGLDKAESTTKTRMQALGAMASGALTIGLGAGLAAIGAVGAGLMDVSAKASDARTAIQGINDVDLSKVLGNSALIARRYGEDQQKVWAATNTLVQEFGLSFDEANDLILAGFEKGLNRSGDFLDSLGEYSNLFSDNGFAADEFFSVMETGMAGGVLGTDKAADAMKEFGIRIRELPDELFGPDGGLTNILPTEEIDRLFQGLQDGSVTVAQAFNTILPALQNVENEVYRNTLGVQLFGTQWEDLGASAMLGIDAANTSMADLAATAETGRATIASIGEVGPLVWDMFTTALLPANDAILSFINSMLNSEGVTGDVQEAIGALSAWYDEKLKPIFDNLAVALLPAVNAGLTVLSGLWSDVLLPALEGVWGYLNEYILPALTDASAWLAERMPGAIMTLQAIFTTVLLPILRGFVDFLRFGVFPILQFFIDMFFWIVQSIYRAILAVQDFVNNLRQVSIPYWLQGHSPPPLANWLTDIGDAMAGVTAEIPAMAELSGITPLEPSYQSSMTMTVSDNRSDLLRELIRVEAGAVVQDQASAGAARGRSG